MIKVLHWWGVWGNIIFGTGMIIECLVFILYGLDRPANQSVISENVMTGTSSFSSETQQPMQISSAQQSMTTKQQAPLSAQPATVIVHQGEPQSPYIAPSVPEIDVPQNLSSHAEEYGKQMENLNRNLSGLNTIYEIQLKSISGQIDTIAQINNGLNRLKTMYSDTVPDGEIIKKETDKMADQLRELNEIYARMISAMTNK